MKTTKNYCENEQKINIDHYRKMKKDIRKQYQKARYHNMSDEEKQKLKDYQKNYREARKCIFKCISSKCIF